MQASILAVGSELLGTERLDTNSLRLAELLREFGVQLVGKAVVDDNLERLAHRVSSMLAETDLVLVTGGLGPTSDDLTREAVAQALGIKLEVQEAIVEDIRARFQAFGMPMPEVNRCQAEVLDGAEVIPNPRGTAPGLWLKAGRATLFLFPGVPHELEGMIESTLRPWLASHSNGERIETRRLWVACRAESQVEEVLAPVYDEFGPQAITVLASPGEIKIEVTAAGDQDARVQLLDRMEERMRELLGDAIFSSRLDDSLEAVVGELLRRRGWSVATAESCTGGLLAERLTRVPGSSDYLVGSLVSYANQVKVDVLEVDERSLLEDGAVSAAVAEQMARGARKKFATDLAVACTGIAGPGGGSPEKPVGTVYLALAGPEDDAIQHRELKLPGDRQKIRWLTSQWGLDMLRRTALAGA